MDTPVKITADERLASRFVSDERLWNRHLLLAKIGEIPNNGVCRLALSKEDSAARALVISWARQLQLTCASDPIGNIFLRCEMTGCDPSLAPVVTGSHLDSEPSGGRFDGVFGVLAGLEAVEAIQSSGATVRRPLEIAIWTNEEGSRFQPSYMGSHAFVCPKQLESFLAKRDDRGIRFSAALDETSKNYSVDQSRKLGGRIAAYIEAHIEQGPVLEASRHQIGIVSSIFGFERFEIEVQGEAAHAGTTPRRQRKDALVAAMQIATALYETLVDETDLLRLTIGRMIVEPGSATVVPGRATFTVDIRSSDQTVLDEIPRRVRVITADHAGACSATVHSMSSAPSVSFDPGLREQLARTAANLQYSTMEMPSGAGHDARYLAQICPSAMIFVPSHKGISHNPAEYTAPSDLGNGARVLADVIAGLVMNEKEME